MEIPRGETTKMVYSLIKDEKFEEAIEILEQLLDLQPNSRSALSLAGYCYFQVQSFESSANAYERLATFYPQFPEYQLYAAQALYNASYYEDALNAAHLNSDSNPSEQLIEKATKLQSAIYYCTDDTAEARLLVEKCPKTDPDTEISLGCLEYTDGNFLKACEHFEEASKMTGFDSQLWYNWAVAAYQSGDIPRAAHYVGEIIEHGIDFYPEIGMLSSKEDKEVNQSVGNTRVLHRTALIEAMNLKAAYEYDIEKSTAAMETLTDIPSRNEADVDPITLHNLAILNYKLQPMEGIRKLRYLIEQRSFPAETFQNLLILYCRCEQYDLIADLMAAYGDFKMRYLSPNTRSFFEALTKREVAPDEAVSLFDELSTKVSESMRKLVKKAEEAQSFGKKDEARTICDEFDALTEQDYIPVIMAMGKIYWEREDFVSVERTLRQACEFLEDKDCWFTNVAHTVYIRAKDYRDAAGFYEMVFRKHANQLLDMSAVSLANLCVCFILIHRNEEAEKVMKKVEAQEKALLLENPGVKVFHHCIINMVIGTLYCVKKNYNFGILRIIKSLEDFKTRLGPDTWLYAKRCILSMLELMTKNSITVEKDVIEKCNYFLQKCEDYGKDISTVIEEKHVFGHSTSVNPGSDCITVEARHLRWLLNRVSEHS